MDQPKKLLELVSDACRARQFSRRTEQAYVGWARRFVVFHGKRHPAELGEAAITEFLTELATHGRASSATQNQAASSGRTITFTEGEAYVRAADGSEKQVASMTATMMRVGLG